MSSKIRTIYLNSRESSERMKMSLPTRCLNIPSFDMRRVRSIVAAFLALAMILSLMQVLEPQSHSSPTILKTESLAAELPELNLTYYSNWNRTPYPVNSGDRLSGDHIILNATWTPAASVNSTLIEVNATAIPMVIENSRNGSWVSIDTRSLGNNASVTINCTTWLANGTPISQLVDNVFLGNFFEPHIELLSPNGGEVWTGTHNISWIAWDNNTEETLTFEVLLSSDEGRTFQLLESGVTTNWVEWNTDGFSNLSTYMIQVRAMDGIYTVSDTSDSPFRAGNVNTDPTTSTTTTSQNGNEQLRIAIFIAAAIILSALLSVIVYYLAKSEF